MSFPSSRCRFGRLVGPDEGWPLGVKAEELLWRQPEVVLTVPDIDLWEELPKFTRHTKHGVAMLGERAFDVHEVDRFVFVHAFASETRGVLPDTVYQLLELGLDYVIGQWTRTAQLAGLEADVVASIHDGGD